MNETPPVWEWDNWPGDTIVLIPCSGSKRGELEYQPAVRLYTGSLFRAALKAARAMVEDRWITILSARHGFVRLDQQLLPYDQKWGYPGHVDVTRLRFQAEQMHEFLEIGGNEPGAVVSLMPAEYTRWAATVWKSDPAGPLVKPLDGCAGIGEMRQRLGWIAKLDKGPWVP